MIDGVKVNKTADPRTSVLECVTIRVTSVSCHDHNVTATQLATPVPPTALL
jgi:hypothetical protein